MKRPIDSFSIVQQLLLIELAGRNRRVTRGVTNRRRAEPSPRLDAEIEDRALPHGGVLLGLLAGRLGLLEHRQHSHASGTGGTEGPALDQCLDRLLVHGAAVDALAEIEDVLKIALAIARLP